MNNSLLVKSSCYLTHKVEHTIERFMFILCCSDNDLVWLLMSAYQSTDFALFDDESDERV